MGNKILLPCCGGSPLGITTLLKVLFSTSLLLVSQTEILKFSKFSKVVFSVVFKNKHL